MLPEAPQFWWKWGVQTFSQRTTSECTGEYHAVEVQCGRQVWELGLRHHHSLSPAHHSWARIKWKCGGEGLGVGLEDNAVIFLILFRNGLVFNLLCLGLLLAKEILFSFSLIRSNLNLSVSFQPHHPPPTLCPIAFFSSLKTILLLNSLSSVPAHLIFLRFDKGLFVRLWN